MSLLEQYAKKCVFINRQKISDGAGGFIVGYSDGFLFTAVLAQNSTAEIKTADRYDTKSEFSVMTDKAIPIDYGDIFKDVANGEYYRITSRPQEKISPASSSFSLMFCTAERWEKP